MRIYHALWAFILCFPVVAISQQVSAPEAQSGSIIGTVTDVQDNPVPDATVTLDGSAASDHATVTTNDTGFFVFKDLHPAVSYHVAIIAKNFSQWNSPVVVLSPGQQFELTKIQLTLSVVETSVTAVLPEQLALEQVKVEETQRILGVIPNFYVVYDPNAVALTTKLKYRLALRAGTDVVTFAGAAFIAGLDQAADTPDYQQGAKGYGQRFGANYADGLTDILIGGAVLPSLLHQDPRYFYQGTGTNKSRALHALEAPFICKGDNGKTEINWSSMGGDLASGAISELYYPESNRGPGLVFENALVDTAGRMAETLLQEFVFRKFTTHSKP